MKTITPRIAVAGLLVCFSLFSACKKEKVTTNNGTTGSKTSNLTKAAWKYTNIRYSINNSPWIDMTSSMPACILDNTVTFLNNFTTIDDEGASTCSPLDPQTSNGIWSFIDGESRLFWNGDFAVIKSLDNSTLLLAYTDTTGTDIEQFEWTFTH